MTMHKATPVMIPPNALRRLLGKVMRQLRPNPQLRVPYEPSGKDIWKYYDNIQIYPVLSDNMLVILLTITPTRHNFRIKHLSTTQLAHRTFGSPTSGNVSIGGGIFCSRETRVLCHVT